MLRCASAGNSTVNASWGDATWSASWAESGNASWNGSEAGSGGGEVAMPELLPATGYCIMSWLGAFTFTYSPGVDQKSITKSNCVRTGAAGAKTPGGGRSCRFACQGPFEVSLHNCRRLDALIGVVAWQSKLLHMQHQIHMRRSLVCTTPDAARHEQASPIVASPSPSS